MSNVVDIEGLKHRQVDGSWLAIVYWGGYGIQVLDLNVFSDEAEADAWITTLIQTLPRGDPITATLGAEPLAMIAVPRKRTDDGMFSVPTGPGVDMDRQLKRMARAQKRFR
jgi:hypothetical protein